MKDEPGASILLARMMEFAEIDSLDDPRLALYRNLKDGELAAQGDRFIVEGHFVVQRVLVSDFPVDSVMIARRKLEEMRSFLRPDVPVYLVPDSMVNRIVGFQFHTGVMAIARRKPSISIEQLMSRCAGRCTLVVLPETSSLQNMGGLIAGGAAPSATQPATSESAAAKPAVSIDNFKFTPATLTVAAGTTVTWVNHDDVPHTVTSKGEAPVFDSGALDTDEKFSFTFSKPGSYPYYCKVHTHMKGVVIVK